MGRSRFVNMRRVCDGGGVVPQVDGMMHEVGTTISSRVPTSCGHMILVLGMEMKNIFMPSTLIATKLTHNEPD